jgi:hypothetical protein
MTRGFVITRISGMQQMNVSTAVIVQCLLLAKNFFQRDPTHIVLRNVTRSTEDGDKADVLTLKQAL